MVSVLGFVASATNRTIDNNVGKTFGVQATVTPIEELSIYAGYVGGPEQDDFLVQTFDDGSSVVLNYGSANRRWQHTADLVVTYDPSEQISSWLNVTYTRETLRPDVLVEDTVDVHALGVALTGRYALNEKLAGAIRAEVLKDFDGYLSEIELDTTLLAGTLTVEARPAPQLIFRLDLRADYASVKLPEGATGEPPEVFLRGANETSSVQPTITLGVIATTN
jgi:hypothetical protein